MNKILSLKQESIEAFCQKTGLRLTHQRLKIYKELSKSEDHPSAELLYQRLYTKLPTLSLDTVYRTLSMFCKYGVIRKIATVESQARFEIATEKHHHIFCKECHKITNVYWPEVELLTYPREFWQGQIEYLDVLFTGICLNCEKSSIKTQLNDQSKIIAELLNLTNEEEIN